MHFLITAHDGRDSDAPARRQAAREAHLEGARRMQAAGEMLFGAALLDDEGNMIGSAMLVDLPDRTAVDAWLARDPYTTGGVWQEVSIVPCKVSVR